MMKLTSAAFRHLQFIPKRHTGEGEDISPPLEWSNVPSNAKEFILIMEDPDATSASHEDGGVFVHWLVYNISANTSQLPEGLPLNQLRVHLPVSVEQGTNSFGKIGYRGPMPPPGHGVHHYHFKLYALDVELGVRPGLTRERILKAMEGHVISVAELMGVYERKAVELSA